LVDRSEPRVEFAFNPYSYEFHDDPFPIYRRLRDEAPVYRNDALCFWAIARHADVLQALHDPATYCSGEGITLEAKPPLPMMLTTDPPEHTAMRRLASREFTPRRIADLEPTVRALSTASIDEFIEAGRADLVGDYAAKLPMDVISRMLGVPRADDDMLRAWSDALLHREEGVPDVTPAGIDAYVKLNEYFARHVAMLRTQPGDDLASALVQLDVDGERLSDDELVGFCFLLIIAGNETTTKLLANALYALQRNPEQKQKVLDDPARIPDAVEETLRHEGSTQIMARTLTRDTELHGETMHAGDKVLLLLGSANRDERVFANPDVFDIDRPRDPQHVGFGHGIHVCLGAALARLEMRVSLEELLRRLPDYEIDPSGLERVHSGNVRGYSRVPITFTRNRREATVR
jgi:cytochrome P450